MDLENKHTTNKKSNIQNNSKEKTYSKIYEDQNKQKSFTERYSNINNKEESIIIF